MLDIAGSTSLVTGGSAGVGLALARRLVQFGAQVAITGRDPARLAEAAGSIAAPQKLMTIAWDVADTARASEVLDSVVARYGALHVLVNNAGCNHRGALESIGPEQAAKVLDTNLRAPVVLTRLALPHLRRAGRGAIVNVASLAGRLPLSHEACYSASKFGLRGFTLSLAEELAGSGISASLVSPGPIDTGFITADLDHVPDLVFSQPMSSAEEIADLVIACIRDGRAERAHPVVSGVMANLGYLFPPLSRALRPLLERRGRRAKALFRARGG
jgi:hypothetical protein